MAGNFGSRKLGNYTIHVAKTKVLISFAVTVKPICAFVFAYAKCWFSHDMARMYFIVGPQSAKASMLAKTSRSILAKPYSCARSTVNRLCNTISCPENFSS